MDRLERSLQGKINGTWGLMKEGGAPEAPKAQWKRALVWESQDRGLIPDQPPINYPMALAKSLYCPSLLSFHHLVGRDKACLILWYHSILLSSDSTK